MMTMRMSDKYHALPTCHIHIEVRINLLQSKGVTFLFKLSFAEKLTWHHIPKNLNIQKVVMFIHSIYVQIFLHFCLSTFVPVFMLMCPSGVSVVQKLSCRSCTYCRRNLILVAATGLSQINFNFVWHLHLMYRKT